MIEEKWRREIIVFGCKMKDVLKSFGKKQEKESQRVRESESQRKEGRVREGERVRVKERE